MNSTTTLPVIDPVNPVPIPSLLKNSPHWVTWQAGTIRPSGKFAKYTVHPDKGYKVDARQAANQMPFDTAMHAALFNKIAGGIGFVMTGSALTQNEADEPLYLVELSPSKKGIRMFCLSTDLIQNRNQNGLEMYSSKRFLTVTGWSGKGQLKDCTK
jgi:primase-polymerase (primpol)-like protein